MLAQATETNVLLYSLSLIFVLPTIVPDEVTVRIDARRTPLLLEYGFVFDFLETHYPQAIET
jgi:hypothetical protein